MKNFFKQIGWAGWVVIGLVVVLVIGAIIAANTRGPEPSKDTETEVAVDASDSEVGRVDLPGEDTGESEPAVVEEPIVVEETPETETLPQTGAVGQEEFEYHFDWD